MHESFSNFINTPAVYGALGLALPLIMLAVLITIILKGFALWHSARAGQKWWFVALLVINTMGILEVAYLLFFRPGAPYKQTVKSATTDTSVPPSSTTV